MELRVIDAEIRAMEQINAKNSLYPTKIEVELAKSHGTNSNDITQDRYPGN